jgi:hypothetical protein
MLGITERHTVRRSNFRYAGVRIRVEQSCFGIRSGEYQPDD